MKPRKNIAKRALSLIVALLLVAPVLVACNDSSTGRVPSDMTTVDSGSETTELVKERYANIDYDGYAFRILAISPGEHYQAFISEGSTEIWFEEDSADALQHAVFTRNLLTEDLLKVKIEPLFAGTYLDVDAQIKTLITAGSDDFDLAHGAHFKMLVKAAEGKFYNLYETKPLDLSAEWWDQEYIDTFTYRKNQLYTIVGHYLTLDDYSTAVMFYNKNVVDLYNLEDPADYVDAGTWTIEKMMDMASITTADISGDGKMTADDTWGLLDNGYSLVHFIEGCDLHMTENDEDGVPQVIIDQEKFINTVQFVWEKVTTSQYILEQTNDEDLVIIKDDRALFYHEVLGALFNFRDMEGDFSLLPMPKMNEEQKNYTSTADGIWCTALAIPLTVRDIEKVATILDTLGGMSTDTVNKSLYEIVLGPQLFREKRTVEMLKYCLDARRYDWAKDVSWAYPIYTAISNQGRSQTFQFASALQSNIKIIKAQLRRFLQGLPK